MKKRAFNNSLHFLVITDLEGMIFEGVEFGQLDINNLFLLARAWSLGRSRRRFSLNGSLYLGRSLGGLGSLGGFLRFLTGSWFLCRITLLAGSLFLSGRSRFFLVCLGRTASAFWGLWLFLLLDPGLLVRRLSHAQIGVISALICAFYRRSLGRFSIVSIQPCPLFSDSGSKVGQA